jgi:hypothetical protein
MSEQLGPLEILCEAPPYSVVDDCQWLGFQAPLDVCWREMSHFHREEGGLLDTFYRMLFFGKRHSKKATCRCGEPLPVLKTYTFWLAADIVVAYRLGQCRRCRTIFWEEAIPELEQHFDSRD